MKMKIENCELKTEKFLTVSLGKCGGRSNLQFAIVNFQFSIPSLFTGRTLLFALCPPAHAQVIADKAVASVTNGSRATPDLITYSDLIWQLALEPATPFAEKPSSEDLN